jgi:hypothetical protein
MTHKVFGQLEHRQERSQRYQNWLNCEQVLPGGERVAPPVRIDVPSTVRLIKSSLVNSDSLRIDVQGDQEAIPLVRAQLTTEENQRVQFSA